MVLSFPSGHRHLPLPLLISFLSESVECLTFYKGWPGSPHREGDFCVCMQVWQNTHNTVRFILLAFCKYKFSGIKYLHLHHRLGDSCPIPQLKLCPP